MDFKAGSLKLTPGATLLFCTDGLPEQMVGGRQYKENLAKVFFASSCLPPDVIIRLINEDFQEFNQRRVKGVFRKKRPVL